MRPLAILFALALWPSFTQAGGRGDDVYVQGYIRRDGAYVRPHMRSAPDGYFYNNWTTIGNVNPYTGQLGYRVFPPYPYYSSYSPLIRQTVYRQVSVYPATATREEKTQDATSQDTALNKPVSDPYRENRVEAAARLGKLGVVVDPDKFTFTEILELENRVRTANRLLALGLKYNYQDYSYLSLIDIEMRFLAAQRIAALGTRVDWQALTLRELTEMEVALQQALRRR